MKEIERKFLVNDLDVINDCRFDLIQQTYLFNEVNKSLRIRVKNEFAFLTIKAIKLELHGMSSSMKSPKMKLLK